MDLKAIPKLTNSEIEAFTSQMAMILKAGISTYEGIQLMLEETRNDGEKAFLTRMNQRLMETGSFYEALDATGACPDYMLQMVHLGEQAGRLDEVMEALAGHYGREASILRTIRNAVTYPLIMIVMMLVVILVLITKVMPIFQQVFRQLGSEMTGFSLAILKFGQGISKYSTGMIVVLAVIVVLILYFGKSKKGREQIRKVLNRGPFGRKYREIVATCRFASGMALTLKSGLTTEECLEYAESLTDPGIARQRIADARQRMKAGSDLASALREAGIFSGMYARMTVLGQRTGSLDEVMEEIALQSQEDADRRITSLVSALEPTLVIILSLVMGLILLSVMLPLVGIMSNL